MLNQQADAPPTPAHHGENSPVPLRALIVEDNPADAFLLVRMLKAGGYSVSYERVESAEAMREALAHEPWDIVISDYVMPNFDGLSALRLTKESDPDLPFILVSGGVGEEVAVGAMRAGAQDYVIKGELTRLVPAVARELHESAARRSKIEAESALRRSETRLHSILGALEDIIWSIELPSLRLVYLNPAAEKIYGRPVAAFLDATQDWLDAVHPEDRERMRQSAKEICIAGSLSIEYRIVRPDGEVRWIHDRAQVVSNESGCRIRIGIARDITEHKRSQAMLYQAAHYDALTGLPNRALLSDCLTQAMIHAQRRNHMVAVVFIDIDRFKTVNDSLGHEAGDELLRQVTLRLTRTLRTEDTVARLGGDEFVVVLPEIAQEADAAGVAAKLMQAVEPPIEIRGQSIYCTASIGIALFPRDGRDAGTLLKHADAARYRAKDEGRNGFRFYDAMTSSAATAQLELEKELREALINNELELHYQPQVDLTRDGAVYGFEALLRWRHPRRGLLPPLEFIPFAEETGLIVPIGEWVLREACRQCKQWTEAFDSELRVAVNLSVRQFVGDNLVRTVAAALAASDLPAKNLEVELTESLLMQDVAQSVKVLKQLKTMGVTLAVDDFGTGYSSLAYLKRFPLDEIKIDKSFVRDITSDPDDAAICASIMAMANALRLRVVAEGVETEAQLGFLQQRQCQAMQGYLFSRPLPAEDATNLLRSSRRQPLVSNSSVAPVRKLLLLDDEENILSALKRLFRRDGYEIFTTTDAAAAFDILAQHRVGVIISDQRMPGMSGTEFLRRVKDLYPDTIRIVLSGYTELQSVTDAINEGAIYRFLTKPWEDEQLRTAIREAFQHQELAWENARLARQARDAGVKLAQTNEQLQQLLAEKSRRIARDATFLGIAQEAMNYVPLPLIGADSDGLIVMANAAALALLPGLIPGITLSQGLPSALARYLLDEIGPTPERIPIGGSLWQPRKQRMGLQSGSSGWLLMLLPECVVDRCEGPEPRDSSAEAGAPCTWKPA